MDGFSRRRRRDDDRLSSKVEGYPQNISVLDIKQTFVVEFVGLSAQRTTDNLLTKQLGSERPNAQYVADIVCIPTLGEHRYRNHTTNRIPQSAWFANGVHDLAEQFLVADLFGLLGIACTFNDFTSKTCNFIGSHLSEILVKCITGLQLFAIDQ